jgi:hypothetical protein
MISAGQSVVALVDLISDDRAAGVDDGSPIIPAGTKGVVMGRSEHLCPPDCTAKSSDCWVVDWGGTKFDTHENEMR